MCRLLTLQYNVMPVSPLCHLSRLFYNIATTVLSDSHHMKSPHMLRFHIGGGIMDFTSNVEVLHQESSEAVMQPCHHTCNPLLTFLHSLPCRTDHNPLLVVRAQSLPCSCKEALERYHSVHDYSTLLDFPFHSKSVDHSASMLFDFAQHPVSSYKLL